MVYWNNTDVALALIGGAMISLSSILNLLFMGRITGLSGMLFTIVNLDKKSGFMWKVSFVLGLISSIFILRSYMLETTLGVKLFDGVDNQAGLSLPG